MVVVLAVVAAEPGQLEAVSVAVEASMVVVLAVEQDSVLVDQDSVVVPSMEEWAVSSNVTMQIGTAIGIVVEIIRGMDIVAVLLTGRGSSSISDLSRGTAGPTTITTPTITIHTGTGDTATERMAMIPAFTIASYSWRSASASAAR